MNVSTSPDHNIDPNNDFGQPGPATADRGASTSWDRGLARTLLRAVGDPPLRVALWDGFSVARDGAGAPAEAPVVRFHDRAALHQMLYKPSRTFGVLFTQGRASVQGNLVDALGLIYEGLTRIERSSGPLRRNLHRLAARRPRANSVERARDNIHSHYDLGNDFYRLWLDHDHLQYTCAYFPDFRMSLEQAQAAKLELICRKLALKPGERIVEAGGGWGGLAIYLARQRGVHVTSYNISHEQIAFAQAEARRAGVDDLVRFIEDDYRNIRGKFDAFVSVGMLEHVGPRNFRALGAVIDGCLTGNGRGLIHMIGQLEPRRMNEWIESYIFPGAEPPTLGQMTAIFEPFLFAVADVENLRPHYARTLELWLHRFQQQTPAVSGMFDDAFVRAWRLYLAGATAAFERGGLQLFQVLFQRGDANVLPPTREHCFASGLVPSDASSRAAR